MDYPQQKKFAFTIIDDTDNATITNVKPVYDLLYNLGFLTTKTVWVYPSRNHFTGQSLQDDDYVDFLKDIHNKGFDIQLHNVGSGDFSREEIQLGIDIFKQKLGYYPSLQINHADNKDNLYWGNKRFGALLKWIFKWFIPSRNEFFGEEPQSNYFWGEDAKKYIKYIRNRVFNGINTLRYDPKMPYQELEKKYSNYWFSSSDGHTVEEFTALISQKKVDKLIREGGVCIVYTHFASNFVNEHGQVHPQCKERLEYLSKQNGWFVPANQILDYLSDKQINKTPNGFYFLKMDIRWAIHRCLKKIRFTKKMNICHELSKLDVSIIN
jgi:hypothetical protein